MKSQDPQCKKCRRAGEKLFLKGEKCEGAKCTLVKRNFAPGVHGNKGFKRLTNYGKQLAEKQKAKRMYGLREKQFASYFDKSFKKVGKTGELLFGMLENRLDNTVFRLGFGKSRSHARQIVGHGHIEVNGKKVDIPSYQVKVGDIISIKEKAMKSPAFVNIKEDLEKKELVPWISLDKKELKGKITGVPNLSDVALNIDWQSIVEFYSK
ncbi:30S ribosomal protein S4 [Candidatus Falkowbacteria bacterium]|uniref:Small ribosomal subunit protein uS4 n=1 Tax=Candidatus Buchananbacteria bacterium CG10_big_fil_rev_8_21_14_0_10_33_19 TaxID=1974525 RepID=A0A2H0W3L0_9BACT|nr:30S ribosomal protein S4 [Candidatus Falkowbacteria bacterium]PIS05945.1 MAG: 30S ribosomal protein S4 [Candidatus Buchananbacteria bacterium CG10_big_fil_rev_8_21_14_0_10_33_19]